MKNLKVWQKLVFMGMLSMLPFAVVTYKMVSSINELGVEFARQEVRGLEYHAPLLALLKDLQQHRGMAAAFLSGDASFKGRLAGKRADIENALKLVDGVDRRLDGALHTSKSWSALSSACRDVLNKTEAWPVDESFEQHTRVIEDVIALITSVGDASKLTLDPDLDSYYLMNIVIFQGPELGELLAKIRGLGSGIAASQKGTPGQFEKLNRSSILAAYLQQKTSESLNKAFETNPALRPKLATHVQASFKAVEEAAGFLKKLTDDRTADASATDYFAAMTRGVDSIYQLERDAAAALNELLLTRINKHQRGVFYALTWATLGLLAVALIGFLFLRDITRTLTRVVAIANQISAGDLTVPAASEPRRDELGALAQAFDRMVTALKGMVGVAEQTAAGNLTVSVKPQSERDAMGNALATMTEKLALLVGQVHKSGIQVNTSATEIAATAKQQQATANEIAATTVEIGATSREISATSRELVKTMSDVAGVAEQTARLAGSGHTGLSRMQDTMRHIMDAAGSINDKLAVLNEKAGNINQVVTTITKVADQTNLLSLNAAIEAEKAGEYGRGFAVVATEIRRLADQTAVATYDIEQMVKEIQSAVSAGVMGMDKFAEEVRRGGEEVRQVSGQLNQIIEQVQALTPRFETVNEGMQAQASGAQQISEALAQLSEAAQQTVESLRQSSQSIEQLNEAANGLHTGVSRFRLHA